MQISQHSTITVMKNSQVIMTLRINYYALPFIEAIFLSMNDQHGILKYNEDQAIMFLTHKLIEAGNVEFLPFEKNTEGTYLYLIHFENGTPSFSIQHPTDFIDNINFTELLHWTDKSDSMLTSNYMN